MRRVLVSVTVAGLLLAVAAAGCGDPGDGQPTTPPAAGPSPTFAPPPATGPPEHGWEGTVEIDFGSGELTAPGFNDLIDGDTPEWATDPVSTVTVLLHLEEIEGDVDTTQDSGGDEPVIVVTNSALADDSVAAMRYRITLAAGEDGRYRFTDGEVSWRCQPERGPQEFGTEPCT